MGGRVNSCQTNFKIPEGAVLIEGCDCAIACIDGGRAVYSYALLVDHFMLCEGWPEIVSFEWVDKNIIGQLPYVSDNGPIIHDDLEDL